MTRIEWESCEQCGGEPTKRVGERLYCDACLANTPEKKAYKLEDSDFENDWELDFGQTPATN